MPGWLHERIVEALTSAARQVGAVACKEHPIRVGTRTLFGDVLVQLGDRTGLVEVELSPDRIAADLEKADAVGAAFLLIATADRHGADAAKRAVRRIRATPGAPTLPIVVAPYALAIKVLTRLLTIDDVLLVPNVNRSTIISTTGKADSQGRGDAS